MNGTGQHAMDKPREPVSSESPRSKKKVGGRRSVWSEGKVEGGLWKGGREREVFGKSVPERRECNQQPTCLLCAPSKSLQDLFIVAKPQLENFRTQH